MVIEVVFAAGVDPGHLQHDHPDARPHAGAADHHLARAVRHPGHLAVLQDPDALPRGRRASRPAWCTGTWSTLTGRGVLPSTSRSSTASSTRSARSSTTSGRPCCSATPRPGPWSVAAVVGAVALSARRLPDLQAVGGELCRHCLTGPSRSSTSGRSSGPTRRCRSSTTR